LCSAPLFPSWWRWLAGRLRSPCRSHPALEPRAPTTAPVLPTRCARCCDEQATATRRSTSLWTLSHVPLGGRRGRGGGGGTAGRARRRRRRRRAEICRGSEWSSSMASTVTRARCFGTSPSCAREGRHRMLLCTRPRSPSTRERSTGTRPRRPSRLPGATTRPRCASAQSKRSRYCSRSWGSHARRARGRWLGP
jgi:hypothetical protein